MYGYIAFYNGQKVEVYANSSFEARNKAIAKFKAPKSKQLMVSVMVAENPDGTPVIHSTSSI